jgi:superfamily II DNA or RNA helicase
MVVENSEWAPMFIYFNTTEKAIKFNKLLRKNNVASEYLIGTDKDTKRKKIKENITDGLITVVCLCGVWNEGESIRELRTVIFGDLRHSSINVRQVSQRGSRKHHSKPFYNIVIPIEKKYINNHDDEDDEYEDVQKIFKVFSDEDPIIKISVEKKVILVL